MKIVHCIYSFQIGGAETMLTNIVNEQVKTNKVFLIVINNNYNAELLNTINKNVKVHLLNRNPGSKVIIPLVSLNLFLFKIKPTIIHCHDESIINVLFVKAHKVLTVHGIDRNPLFFKKYSKLFAISNVVKAKILEFGEYNVNVIQNGINTKLIKISQGRFLSEIFKIVVVGRLDISIKGQDIVLKAISNLYVKYNIKNIELYFIGEGCSLSYLKNLAKNEGIENMIFFKGLKSPLYVNEHLKDYNLLCCPSRYEGFGLTAIEGMAAKIPVLVSKDTGLYEVIRQGEFGYFFKNGDVEDLSKQIFNIYSDYSNKVMIVDKAYNYVKVNYSIERMVTQYQECYERIVK